jgi:hypothetical protein
MEDADVAWLWYWPGMRRNAKSITTSPEIVTTIAELTRINFDLLTKLVPWLDANEKAHRRFRFAMVHRLTRMEAAISLLLVGQLAETQNKPPVYNANKLDQDAKTTEGFIANQCEQVGLKMIRYIYGEEQAPEPRHDRRRKWWGWEI